MITAPSNWNSLWAMKDTVMEMRFTIDGKHYYNDQISASDGRLTHFLYSSYGIGNVCIGKLTITLLEPDTIARGIRTCKLAVRLKNGSTTTTWVDQGTYYLNTAEKTSDGDYKLGLMDGLALTDVYLYANGVVPSSTSYPRAASTEVRAICTKVGITYPTDDSAFASLQVTAPTNMTCRQILQSIAAACGGNWTMAKNGRLKFVPLADRRSATVAATVSVTECTQTSDQVAVTGIKLQNKEETWEYGSDSGIMVGSFCAYATATLANSAYYKISGNKYQGYKCQGAYLSPLVELGDYVEIEDTHERLFIDNYSVTYEQGLWGTFESPMKAEVEQRINYQTQRDQKINMLGELASEAANATRYLSTAEYIDELLERINTQANETGGYTYITEGQGIRTYDVAVEDPLVGAEAHSVVEVKGGTVRIADSRDSQGNWNWRTVFTSGHIAADMVTAAHLTTGFIGSPSGNYWNLNTGEMRMAATTIQQIADNVPAKDVGGTNLIDGTFKWTVWRKSGNWSFNGENAYCSTPSSASWNNVIKSPSGRVLYSDLKGRKVTVSFEAKSTSSWGQGNSNNYFYATIALVDGSGTRKAWKDIPLTLTTSWARHYATVTLADSLFTKASGYTGNFNNLYIEIWLYNYSRKSVYVRKVKFERGEVPTDWCPSKWDYEHDAQVKADDALQKAYTDATTKANKALTDSKTYAKNEDAAVKAFFTQKEVLNRLTGGGKNQGLYLSGSKLYINAEFIKSGSLSANYIKGGTLVASNAQFTSAKIKGTTNVSGTFQYESGGMKIAMKGAEFQFYDMYWKKGKQQTLQTGAIYPYSLVRGVSGTGIKILGRDRITFGSVSKSTVELWVYDGKKNGTQYVANGISKTFKQKFATGFSFSFDGTSYSYSTSYKTLYMRFKSGLLVDAWIS